MLRPASKQNLLIPQEPRRSEKIEMGIWITGYLPDDNDDQFIKYELDVDAKFNDALLELLGHASIEELAIGMWPLTEHQVHKVVSIIGSPLPLDLEIFISVVRD